MLERAQTFQAKTKVDFQSSIRLADAQQQLTYTEEAKASGGTRGELTIPTEPHSGIRPLKAVTHLPLRRVRYRIFRRQVEAELSS
jgi:hypothetical protein